MSLISAIVSTVKPISWGLLASNLLYPELLVGQRGKADRFFLGTHKKICAILFPSLLKLGSKSW